MRSWFNGKGNGQFLVARRRGKIRSNSAHLQFHGIEQGLDGSQRHDFREPRKEGLKLFLDSFDDSVIGESSAWLR